MVMSKDNGFEIELNSFRSLNTKDSPVTMKDDELAILINLMPIGTSLYVVPGISAVLATIGNSEAAWTANTAVTINVTVRRPTVPNGYIYVCSKTGTTHATTEPTWTTTGTTTDGSAEWLPYSLTIKRITDVTTSGGLFKFVSTVGGAIYSLTSSYVQGRINIPSVINFSNPQFEQWKYTHMLIIDPTAGYYSYNGTTLTQLSGTTSAPSAGTCIAIWKGSVFIANGRTIFFSAPDSYTDFTTASGGGSIVDTYPSLRNQINRLVAAQDYLYVVGDHGTHVATGIQSFAGTGTVLTLLDAVPGIGSPYPDSVCVLGSEIASASETGVHAVSGASFQLLSSMLDGMFPGIDTTFAPVGWFANIFNKKVYCLLVRAPHPIDQTMTKFILCFYEDRWFYVNYGLDFVFASQGVTATTSKSFAAYGNSLVEIFVGESLLTKKFRMKAMNFGSPILDKQVLWVGATLVNTTGLENNILATITAIGSGGRDESSFGSASVDFLQNELVWESGAANPMTWQYTETNATDYLWSLPYNDMLGMRECEGRGKRIQIDFEETSIASYSVTGIMVAGQYTARR